MEVTSALFALIVFLAPGLGGVQAFFTSQRLSVVYSDTAFEKIIAGFALAPICHFVTILSVYLLAPIYNEFAWPSQAAPLKSISEAYVGVTQLLFSSSYSISAHSAIVFCTYFYWSIIVSAIFISIITKVSIYFGGVPGFRDGIYKQISGFLEINLIASVITEPATGGSSLIMYKGVVDKIAFTKTGDIRFVYLKAADRSLVSFHNKNPETYKVGKIKGLSRRISNTNYISISDQHVIALPEVSQDQEDLEAYFEDYIPRRLFIDGSHIKNIFFESNMVKKPNSFKAKIVERFPDIFDRSFERLEISRQIASL